MLWSGFLHLWGPCQAYDFAVYLEHFQAGPNCISARAETTNPHSGILTDDRSG